MVMATRCPNPQCRKYMLVEDRDRGQVVPCLVCKQPIKVPAASPSPTSPTTSPIVTPRTGPPPGP